MDHRARDGAGHGRGPDNCSEQYCNDHIETVDGEICWVIAVDRSPEPAFVRWKDRKWFFVREGPRTTGLDNEGTYRYITNRWR